MVISETTDGDAFVGISKWLCHALSTVISHHCRSFKIAVEKSLHESLPRIINCGSSLKMQSRSNLALLLDEAA